MNIKTLQNTMIFKNMTDVEIIFAIENLDYKEKTYEKGEVIFHAGSITSNIGLVTAGNVTIESNDIWGNRTILSHVEKGNFFAETYAFLENEHMLVDVTANEVCTVSFFDLSRLRNPKLETKVWPAKLIKNLLLISTHKNLLLSERSFHTAHRTIRRRLMSYFNSVSLQKCSKDFTIPFDRQQLADYLNIDRSALSKELGRMRDDGIISFRKNHFIISEKDF